MIDESLQQLENPDPAIRRQAILNAGRTGERRSLPYLMKIYKTDPDPVMRELALKAGRRIKALIDSGDQPAEPSSAVSAPTSSKSPVATWTPATPPTPPPGNTTQVTPPPDPVQPGQPDHYYEPTSLVTPFVEPEEPTDILPLGSTAPAAPTLPPIRKLASPRERELAKGRLDTAISHKLQGNVEKAVASLADALRINPDLETDVLAMNLATTLTGINAPAEAIAAVKQRNVAQAAAPRGKAKPTKTGDESSVMNTLLDVLIYFGVTVVLSLIVVLVLAREWDQMVRLIPNAGSRFTANPFLGAGFFFMMIVIFISAAVSTVVTLVSNTIYFAIGIPLGGAGDWSRVTSAIVRVQIGFAIAYGILMGITLALFPLPPLSGSAAAMQASITRWQQSSSGMSAFSLLVLLGGLIWASYSVGRAHQFGFVKGLITVVGGTVLQCCGCVLLAMAAVPSLPPVPGR